MYKTLVSKVQVQNISLWKAGEIGLLNPKVEYWFFSLYYYYYFCFTILYWFCHTLTWILHGCTWVPNPEPPSHLPPHIISLGHPSAPAPSILYPVSNLDWRFISAKETQMYRTDFWTPFLFLFPAFPSLLISEFWNNSNKNIYGTPQRYRIQTLQKTLSEVSLV